MLRYLFLNYIMDKPKSYSISFTGRRKINQDACIVINEGKFTFLAVADGMGGASGGEIASQAVIEVCKQNITEAATETTKPESLKGILKKIYEDCHKRLSEIISEDPGLTGMGTTLSCVLIINGFYVWANIGDSRVYKISGRDLKQITVDHSFIEEYRSQYGNEIPEYVKSRSHVITRSLGDGKDDPDIFPERDKYEKINSGEGFLICSDGLIPEKADDNTSWIIDYLLGTKSLKEATENMVCHAFHRESTDNISVVLYEHDNFNREKTKITRYKYPPVEKEEKSDEVTKTKSRSSRIVLKKLLILLIILLAGGAIYCLLGDWFTHHGDQTYKAADQEEQIEIADTFIEKTDPEVAMPEEQEEIKWNAWEGHVGSTPLHRDQDIITWTEYPETANLVEYRLEFDPPIDGGESTLTFRNTKINLNDLDLSGDKYSISIKAVLNDGRESAGGIITLTLTGQN